MTASSALIKTQNSLKRNSPLIFTGFGIGGVLITAYMASKASIEAVDKIRQEENDNDIKLTQKEVLYSVWPLYIPTIISATITISCIVLASKASSKKTAAAYSLLTLSEKAFDEYKEKVVEQLGQKKEKAIRDELAQSKVTENKSIIVSGSGSVLCYEMHTGRYFNSDVESIKKAQNTINAQLIRENEANLNDFYYLLNLPQTSYSSATGWTSDKMLDIDFSAVIADDGRPCIAFNYNYIKVL